jgi:hypothetical protein
MPDIVHRVGIAAPAQRAYDGFATEEGFVDLVDHHCERRSDRRR